MDFPLELNYERLLAPLLEFNESSFVPEPYIPPRAISSAHRQPRFGRPNTLDGVFTGYKSQTREYITGVIIGSLIIAIVAIVWFFAIICLKIAGTKRVGFLAGRFVRPYSNREEKGYGGADCEIVDGDEIWSRSVVGGENNETIRAKSMENSTHYLRARISFGRRVGIVRVLFVLSGIAVIISGGLFYGKGAVSFKNSIDEVQEGIDMVKNVCETTLELTANVTKAADDVEKQSQPDDIEGEPICGLDSETSTQIRSVYNELVANIDQLRSTVDEHLVSINGDVSYVLSLMHDIEYALYWADIFFYVLIAITVVIISLIVAILTGAFFAWKGISNSFTKCIQYALIWPLFIFCLGLSWIFATLFLAAGLAGADFCVTPDRYVEDFLNAHKDMFDGILFGFIIYYVTGCTVVPPGAEYMRQISTEVAAVMTMAHELMTLMSDLSVESIAELCGVSITQATTLKDITTLGHAIIHVLNKSVVGLREVLSCETMNPIYTTFVHQALCDEAVAGMSWIFFTTLFIAIFSMLLIMFRASLYPIKDFALPASSSDENGIEVVAGSDKVAEIATENIAEIDVNPSIHDEHEPIHVKGLSYNDSADIAKEQIQD